MIILLTASRRKKSQEIYKKDESFNDEKIKSADGRNLKLPSLPLFDRPPKISKEKTEMVKNTNNNLTREIDKLSETETLAVVSYISQILSKRISKQTNLYNDDLIVSLSERYENKRARAVVEWEKLRRQQQSFGRAA